ncbi:hypothetical protein [Rhodococcus sp. 66b]|uniref:hypothetical protein n=1 Tax=Rhodococcus sp. 66b TaxID=1945511 RepID=UPI0009BB87E1|nr:hypothetical protein [Rhodococcus sp. 66b]OQM82073.1 hypothetical protein B0E55_01698 [Rhodococcus sp. 66b]
MSEQLTDPIAAHLTELITDAPDEDNYDAGYVAALADLRGSAAFKLVVEQHTNGRIAELDWDELVAAIPDGWELQESAHLEEVSRVRQRDLEASQATTARWRARAEKAEATIARVENALPDTKDAEADDMHDIGWGRGQQVLAGYIRSAIKGDELRAALEGKQP